MQMNKKKQIEFNNLPRKYIRKSKERLQYEKSLIDAQTIMKALEEDYDLTTLKNIAEASGLKRLDVEIAMTHDTALAKLISQRRGMIRSIAVDNIHDIMMNPSHPKHYEASKYVVDTFVTELDKDLEKKGDEAAVDTTMPVQIIFSK